MSGFFPDMGRGMEGEDVWFGRYLEGNGFDLKFWMGIFLLGRRRVRCLSWTDR